MPRHFESLDGLKRAAKKLKREQGISHGAALEGVAREGGFPNYFAAATSFAVARDLDARAKRLRHFVTISDNWADLPNRLRGTETRTFEIGKPLAELVKPHHLTGYLSGCKLGDPDTIIGYGKNISRDDARFEICRVARALQFMAATGLRPSDSRRCYPKGKWDNRPPGSDHDHGWYHPKTGSYILTEEPYGRFIGYEAERKAWAAKHGWRTIKSRWGCIYGHGTELYLTGATKGEVRLAGLARRLAALPEPYDVLDWPEDKEAIPREAPRRAATRRISSSNETLSVPVEIIEMSPELSARLRQLREIENAEAGPQAPEPTIDHLGVTITSRWGLAHELERMCSIVDAMPGGVQSRIGSIWCDSNCQAYYTVTVVSGRWIEGIEFAIRDAVLVVTDGFNGLSVEGGGRSAMFDAEWAGDDDFDRSGESVP